jgi:hypothetical protein
LIPVCLLSTDLADILVRKYLAEVTKKEPHAPQEYGMKKAAWTAEQSQADLPTLPEILKTKRLSAFKKSESLMAFIIVEHQLTPYKKLV